MKNEANNQDIGNQMPESIATLSLPVRPDPEVSASKARRKFTAQYKLVPERKLHKTHQNKLLDIILVAKILRYYCQNLKNR